MAQNTNISIPQLAWTQITNADVTSITFQNVSGNYVLVKGTAGETAPTDRQGAIRYNTGQGERNVALADLFPGISATRVWVFTDGGSTVMVSHA